MATALSIGISWKPARRSTWPTWESGSGLKRQRRHRETTISNPKYLPCQKLKAKTVLVNASSNKNVCTADKQIANYIYFKKCPWCLALEIQNAQLISILKEVNKYLVQGEQSALKSSSSLSWMWHMVHMIHMKHVKNINLYEQYPFDMNQYAKI